MPGDFRILEARTGIGHFWVFWGGEGEGISRQQSQVKFSGKDRNDLKLEDPSADVCNF